MQWLNSHLPVRAASALEALFTRLNLTVSLESRLLRRKIQRLFSEDMLREYEELRPYFPERAEAILDIGAGIGGIDVFLYKHYKNFQPRMFLLDKTEMPAKVYYGLEKQGCFYNSLELAKEFLSHNDVPEEKVFIGEANTENRIPFDGPFDLIISLISWGFHYPVETYLDEAYDKLKPGGVLILDIRRTPEHKALESIQNKFGNSTSIREGGKHIRLLARK